MVRELVACAVLLFASICTFAQPAGYVEVPHRGIIATQPFGCFLEPGFYDAAKLKAAAKKPNCSDLAKLGIDSQKESLVYYRVGSDCHMRVAVKVFRVDAEKKFKVFINNIYGGCRAGGTRAGWLVFEKMPPGYNVDMSVVMVDRVHEASSAPDGFVFPKPPSTVKRETLATPTEIDLKGCLPLTGQSRWVIQHDGHLQTAIGHGEDVARCRDVFDQLDLDFTKFTLAGFSFASGHCERPPGLQFELVKETSSDSYENRFVLTATFDEPKGNYCKTWTTYPVWLLVPKLPADFGFSFDVTQK